MFLLTSIGTPEQAKKDLFENILDKAPWEAYSVREAIIKGQIDGSKYAGSGCRCIKGIIAKNNGLELVDYETMDFLSKTYGITTGNSPLERYILWIEPGMIPETDERCANLLVWLDEYIAGYEAMQTANLGASVLTGLDEVMASSCELLAAEEVAPELVEV